MYMRSRDMQGEFMVAICDQECMGNTYREGKLSLKITPNFYGEQLVSLEKAISELKKATIANLVGTAIIKECIRCGLIHEKGVIWINGIPHAQIIKMR
ncbi:MAG: DUF424 family protein [Candidatus Helarchaeota archaeon]|nr:DUF424 family protein [Candidatus Helarchaeota archaeon]